MPTLAQEYSGAALYAGIAAQQPRGRIWVVDDSRLESDRACSLLSDLYTTEAFSDGATMLERLGNPLGHDDAPDVVLVDWQMPGVSGLELCRFLREQFDEVTLPILMVTSRGAREDFAEGLAAGANDYLAKPYDHTELRARVSTLLRIRRQADAIRERELWLNTTLRSIGDGVIATNAAGQVVFMNAVAELLTGWTHTDATTLPFSEVCQLVDDDGRPVESPVTAALGSGVQQARGPTQTAVILRRGASQADGRIPVESTASPIRAGERVVGVVFVFRDIVERQRNEAAARARGDFEEKLIGIVSHDLRNPLQAIVFGASALLRREDLDARAISLALRIQSSADRATRLVLDLLDFTQARFGSGIPIRRSAVDLHRLGAVAVDEAQAAHPSRNIVHEASGNGAGEWDSDRVAQVLSNLLSNALKYGVVDGPVTLRTRGEADAAFLEVHNDGGPIAADMLPHLFEPMKRGEGASDIASRSVGLGLYIVKHVVDAHGGGIEVASADTGTTFVVRLPRRP